jgi:YVTN family beta-propeller protein
MKFRSSLIRGCVAAFGVLAIGTITYGQRSSSASGYHLADTIQVGGEGGWDYVFADADGGRLYVSHATKVVVIDTATDKVIGEIPNTNGVHGIAIAGGTGRGFISDGRDNAVTIFDTKTLKPLGTVPTGKNPDAIIYDPASKRVFAFNGGSANATVIDAADGKVAGTIELGGKPEFAVADGKGNVFVNLEDKSEVVAIDSAKMAVKSHWSIAPGEEPSGLALDQKTMRLFIAGGNKKMIVMDAASGKVLADLPTGDGTDAAAFDPGTKLAFASNGEGTLTVVSEDGKDRFAVKEVVKTQRGARTMAVDIRTHKIYLPTAQFGPPPAPTPERPRPRPTIVPNSFVILVYAEK